MKLYFSSIRITWEASWKALVAKGKEISCIPNFAILYKSNGPSTVLRFCFGDLVENYYIDIDLSHKNAMGLSTFMCDMKIFCANVSKS